MPDFSPLIGAYRHKETQPTKYSISNIYDMARSIEANKAVGGPPQANDYYLNHLLVEGRSDAGANNFDYNKPQLQELAQRIKQKLDAEGIAPDSRAFVYGPATAEKLATSARTGIPFPRLWNGTGRSADTGRTGEQHNERWQASLPAVQDPRNKGLVDLFERAKRNDLSPQEWLSTDKMSRVLRQGWSDSKLEQSELDKFKAQNPQFGKDLWMNEAVLTDPKYMVEAYKKRSGIAPAQYSANAPKENNFPADWRRSEVDKLDANPAIKAYWDRRFGVDAPTEQPKGWIDSHIDAIRSLFTGKTQ